MAILEKSVWVTLGAKNIKHYENLGYEIPRTKNKNGELVVTRETEIEVKIKDLPVGSETRLTKICDDCEKHIQNQSYKSILKNRENKDNRDRCCLCGQKYGAIYRKNNVKYEKSAEWYYKNNNMDYLINEFSTKNPKKLNEISSASGYDYLWSCPKCGSDYLMSMNARKKGQGCHYCSSNKVNHTNCIATTHPDKIKIFKYPELVYKLTAGSKSKTDFICTECKYEIKDKKIADIIRSGLSCPKCSDGVSYPEKFVFNILNQLGIEFEMQKLFNWSEGKKYDFYIPSLNCIIEVHGLQHYNGGFASYGGRTLKEEKDNDKLKENLAIENSIKNYIVIDARMSEFEYMQNSVINGLSKLIDLSNINWVSCKEFTSSSLIKVACDLWNSGIKSTKDIAEVMKLSRITVTRYLKQGAEVGWCGYNPKEERKNRGKEISIPIVQLTLVGALIREFKSAAEASRQLKIQASNIARVCKGKSKTVGGFRWMYKEDYEIICKIL